MSKTKTHVLVPYTIFSACGVQHPYKNAGIRENVTCARCKKSEYYKLLPSYKVKGKK